MESHLGSGLRLARAKAFPKGTDLVFQTEIDSASQRVSHWALRWAKLMAIHLELDWAKCLASQTDSVKGSQKESG